jgi:hypothetical protein
LTTKGCYYTITLVSDCKVIPEMKKFILVLLMAILAGASSLAAYELLTGGISQRMESKGLLDSQIPITGTPNVADDQWTKVGVFEKSTFTLYVSTSTSNSYRLEQNKDNYIDIKLSNGKTSVRAVGPLVEGKRIKLNTFGNQSIFVMTNKFQIVDLKTTHDLTVDLEPFDEVLSLENLFKFFQ